MNFLHLVQSITQFFR